MRPLRTFMPVAVLGWGLLLACGGGEPSAPLQPDAAASPEDASATARDASASGADASFESDASSSPDAADSDGGSDSVDASADAAESAPDAAQPADASAPPEDAGPNAGPDAGPAGFHPATWLTPGSADFHGDSAKRGLSNCQPCHGADLLGGAVNVSCDRCHSGWKSQCTFCHGGNANQTGAPPRDVTGGTATTLVSVGAHTSHVASKLSTPLDCTACHVKPTGALSPGHIDTSTTPQATVTFAVPASTGWDRTAGRCGVYCHGGFPGGNAANAPLWTSVGTGQAACGTCHALPPATGKHASHITRGATCGTCHPDAAATGAAIANPALHVDGSLEVALAAGTWDPVMATCSNTCHTGTRSWTATTVHSSTWATPGSADFHGDAAKQGLGSCQGCHGTDLLGGTAGVSCEQCHGGWKNQCTFCHGGSANQTGAPPVDVTGGTATTLLSVGAHTSHVGATLSAPVDCTACHVKPIDALSTGHIDASTTPRATVTFSVPASTGWDRTAATCGIYCHGAFPGGNAANAPVWTSVGTGQATCGTCHALPPATGKHASHVTRGAACGTCHPDAAATGAAITTASLHVDGTVEVALPTGSWDPAAASCSNTCHSGTRSWTGTTVHSSTWATPGSSDFHGIAAKQGLGSCQGCHGADLLGGTAGVSCEQCHGGWKNQCAFCHGGSANQTGAPPVDVAGGTATTLLSVGAHTSHVAATLSSPLDCSACHVKPIDALSPGHIDASSTPQATVTFTVAASTGWDRTAATCGIYCHGAFPGGNTANRPVWTRVDGTQATCGSCHPRSPSTGEHGAHVTRGYGCNTCHPDADAAGAAVTQSALHVDGAVQFAPKFGGSYSGATCAVYCHGAFTGGNQANAPSWTNGPAQTCSTCHAAPPSTGRHTSHVSLGRATCADCHPDSNAAGTAITVAASHLNGVKDVGGAGTQVRTWTGTNCAATCHPSRPW